MKNQAKSAPRMDRRNESLTDDGVDSVATEVCYKDQSHSGCEACRLRQKEFQSILEPEPFWRPSIVIKGTQRTLRCERERLRSDRGRTFGSYMVAKPNFRNQEVCQRSMSRKAGTVRNGNPEPTGTMKDGSRLRQDAQGGTKPPEVMRHSGSETKKPRANPKERESCRQFEMSGQREP